MFLRHKQNVIAVLTITSPLTKLNFSIGHTIRCSIAHQVDKILLVCLQSCVLNKLI